MFTFLLTFLLMLVLAIPLVGVLLVVTDSIVLTFILGVVALPFVFGFCAFLLWPLGKLENRIRERFDRPRIRSAKAAFRASHPGIGIEWTRCVTEESRYVVGVFHDSMSLRSPVFYAVDKSNLTATLLEDDTGYRSGGRVGPR